MGYFHGWNGPGAIVGLGPKPTIRILRAPSGEILIVGLGPRPTIRISPLGERKILIVGLGPKPTIRIHPVASGKILIVGFGPKPPITRCTIPGTRTSGPTLSELWKKMRVPEIVHPVMGGFPPKADHKDLACAMR